MPVPTHSVHLPPQPVRWPWGKRPGALRSAGEPHLGHFKWGEVTCPFRSAFTGVSVSSDTSQGEGLLGDTARCAGGAYCRLSAASEGRAAFPAALRCLQPHEGN